MFLGVRYNKDMNDATTYGEELDSMQISLPARKPQRSDRIESPTRNIMGKRAAAKAPAPPAGKAWCSRTGTWVEPGEEQILTAVGVWFPKRETCWHPDMGTVRRAAMPNSVVFYPIKHDAYAMAIAENARP